MNEGVCEFLVRLASVMAERKSRDFRVNKVRESREEGREVEIR